MRIFAMAFCGKDIRNTKRLCKQQPGWAIFTKSRGNPKAVSKAKEDLGKVRGHERSLVGLEAPWFPLKNPGIVSIPLGFLAVLIGSLLFRDRRSQELWPELYARQNTGIRVAKAAVH